VGPQPARRPRLHRPSLTQEQKRWLKRRQAIEPIIGHTKHDHGMKRCWLKGSEGDALHPVLCAARFNIRWLMRAIVRKAAEGLNGILTPYPNGLPTLGLRCAARCAP
jgi:Transposase DDE domain